MVYFSIFVLDFHTTIRHLLVFLERFLHSRVHKFLIMNTKNAPQCNGELSSFYPSKKVLEEGCKREPGTVNPAGAGLQTETVSHYSPPAARRARSNGPAVAGLVYCSAVRPGRKDWNIPGDAGRQTGFPASVLFNIHRIKNASYTAY